ncbi:acyltransferase [Pseudoprevotella muciniphila]|uniref:Acyltransferase n=1 Tax=Pseudoprevotella muciniphila TaxID=2133944 RepID=A0A5P8E8A1_9BACT|nr:acyltransferase [Pseudoprevotella muciniphila]QFQ13172.1 acyltransferase [Pseudoprevotella muciniphila]
MRDSSFSIVKAFGIMLVVFFHCNVLPVVGSLAGSICVSVFFICSGYFFSGKNVQPGGPERFIARRFRSLYVPFLKWAVIFLVLHNLLVHIGVESGSGLGKLYDWQAFSQRLWSVTFNMSGFDEQLSGTFWFFRCLLICSLVMLAILWTIRHWFGEKSLHRAAWVVLLLLVLLVVWKNMLGLKITGVAQGGSRELAGLFMMFSGFLYRKYEAKVPVGWKWWPLCFAILLSVAFFYPSLMSYNQDTPHFFAWTAASYAGFLLLRGIAKAISTHLPKATDFLAYIGDRTLCIFAFHFSAFKVVSLLKVWLLGLPSGLLANHPVTNAGNAWDVPFMALYFIMGVVLPLASKHLYDTYWKNRRRRVVHGLLSHFHKKC